MIADFLGIMALLFVALCVLFFTYRWPAVTKYLWLAFIVRAAAALVHYYVMPLPDSTADALKFEGFAWEWAQGGFGYVWTNFTGPSPYFISWIIALFYSVTERSMLLAQSLSVFMGTGTVLLGWLLIRELWGERAAVKAVWVLIFFPTLVLYSAITMREAYISFFLVLGMFGVVRWARSGSLRSILLAIFGFVGAYYFHGGMIIGLLIFLIIVLWRTLKRVFVGLISLRLQVSAIAIVLLTLVPVGGFITGSISFDYIGNFSQASNLKKLVLKIKENTQSTAGAAYPQWTVPDTPIELLYKGPIRIAYFQFSPFPWDVKGTFHLVGFFDSLLYLTLFFLLWRNRKAIWADPAARLLLIILLAYLFIFGLYVSNFGTSIRHRAKFVLIIIALVAPILPRIRLRNLSLTTR